MRDQEWVDRDLSPAIARCSNVLLEHTLEDIGDIYADAQFVLQASVALEPFGRTVLEGMALGLLPIVPDVGGPAEVVRHGIDGFVYRAADVRALAATLELAARTAPDDLRRMSSSARRRVELCFTADRNAEQVLARVLGDWSGGACTRTPRSGASA